MSKQLKIMENRKPNKKQVTEKWSLKRDSKKDFNLQNDTHIYWHSHKIFRSFNLPWDLSHNALFDGVLRIKNASAIVYYPHSGIELTVFYWQVQ